jgi:signal transduction histidine kinase/ActR/RegA family two-component response regulator
MSEGLRKFALGLATLLFAGGLVALWGSPGSGWAYWALATGGALLFFSSVSERRRAERATLDAKQAALDAQQATRDAERAAVDAKERARVDAERLATALDAAHLGTWEWNIISNATFFSPNIDAILWRAPGGFERTFAAYIALVYPEDRAGMEQAIQDVLKAGSGSYTNQHRIVAPDGSLHWMESKGRLDSDEHGKPFRLAGTLVDISARLEADERNAQLQEQLRQAQKLEALGTLAGGIAHDFNNILGAIVAYTQLAQMDNPDNAELQQQLSEVMRASSRATSLVQQILSFGRRQRQERQACSLSPVFSNAVKLLRSTLPATIVVREDIAPNLPEVMADPIQIHQVLMNLCTNASHAMQGRGELRLELSRYRLAPGAVSPHVELRPGNYLRLAISDDGEGMDEPVLSRIFEPFFTTKAAGGGSGLGLAVAHGIVKEHDGTITVQSQVGKGTTVSVYLPALAAAPAFVDDALAGVPLGHGEHVLFVDDEGALCHAAKHILTRLGYQPHVFQDSEAAWQAFQAEPGTFDVLLTDLTMPQRTGMELAEDVLRLRPDLPVILASGYSVTLTSGMLEERGIRELLYKPLEYGELAATLARVLPQRLGQTA